MPNGLTSFQSFSRELCEAVQQRTSSLLAIVLRILRIERAVEGSYALHCI